MKKRIVPILSLLCALCLIGCVVVAKTKPVFETENISRITFIAYPNHKEAEVTDEYMAEITDWLATFRVGSIVWSPLPPGSNAVCVVIEYSDGTTVENGLSTVRIGKTSFYMNRGDTPECFYTILEG